MVLLHIVGRVVNGPETRQTKDGRSYVTLRVECPATELGQGGRTSQRYIRVAGFGNTARLMEQAKEGDLVSAAGSFSVYASLSRDNRPQASVSMLASAFSVLNAGGEEEAPVEETTRPAHAAVAVAADDEPPF